MGSCDGPTRPAKNFDLAEMCTGPRGEADLVLDTAALTAAQAARQIASALPGPARARS